MFRVQFFDIQEYTLKISKILEVILLDLYRFIPTFNSLKIFIGMIEDKGMIAALNEIEDENKKEVYSEELVAIFNGVFIT